MATRCIPICVIAAADEDMGIGLNNTLPWTLKNELAYFTSKTMTTSEPGKKNAVIMGHRTWLSLPVKHRPLPNRINIVLSRKLEVPPEKAHHLAQSLPDALELVKGKELGDVVDTAWVIGGSEVYRDAMKLPCCRKVYLTRIFARFHCDTFFPDIPDKFVKITDPSVPDGIQEEDGLKYIFEVYENKEK